MNESVKLDETEVINAFNTWIKGRKVMKLEII